jgi:hypothetical protein
MHVPVPDKLWLAPEPAERKAGEYMFHGSLRIKSAHLARSTSYPFDAIDDLVAANRLALHTYAVRSNDFKAGLEARGVAVRIRREYALARLPRFVWVIEAVDRQLRQAGKPSVIGEAVLDATSSDHLPDLLALHLHGVMWLQQTSGKTRGPVLGDLAPYASGGVGDP